jgi:tRNA G18 (ribose-2'-O)-methylase SpoU
MTLDVRIIDSLDHPMLTDYRSLTDVELRSKAEPAEGIYIAESLKILERALGAGHTPRSILTIPTWVEKLHELDRTLPGQLNGVPVFVGDATLLEALTGFHVHRGTLASIHRPPLPTVDELLQGARRVVVLENIVDHTNVGAVFRSVAGIGADAVIVSESCADPLYRRSVRVSMGTVMQVPWTRAGDWDELVATLHSHDFSLVALALSPEAVFLDSFARNAPQKLALVLGSEGDGLSPLALSSADSVVEIPMRGGVDSLNVAAASAVAMWALRPGATESP